MSSNSTPISDDELKRQVYSSAREFFRWNSGKNTPNILIQLSERIERLQKSIDDASRSSSQLAAALNRITFWYAIITGVIALGTIAQVALTILK